MKHTKSVLKGILLFVLSVSLCGTLAFAAGPTAVSDFAGLQAAFTTGGDYQLTQAITMTDALDVTANVTLDLNGFAITAALEGEAIKKDLAGSRPSDITAGTEDVGAIDVRVGGSLTISDGSGSAAGAITNSGNRPTIFNAGTFTLNGGTVSATTQNAITFYNMGGIANLAGGTVAGPQNTSVAPGGGNPTVFCKGAAPVGGTFSRVQLTISGSDVTSTNTFGLTLQNCDFDMTGGSVTATYNVTPLERHYFTVYVPYPEQSGDAGSKNVVMNLSGGSVTGPSGISATMDAKSEVNISGNFNLTATNPDMGNGIMCYDLDMSGGTINAPGFNGIWIEGWGVNTQSTISGGTINASNGINNYNGVIDSISGVTVNATANAIHNSETINKITGGTFNAGGYSIYSSHFGTATIGEISGGTFTSTGPAAIRCEPGTNPPNLGDTKISKISGGTFTGGDYAILNYDTVSEISGGTFIGGAYAFASQGSPASISFTVPANAPIGDSRFFGGAGGNDIFSRQPYTLPNGYKISTDTLLSEGKDCYYITKDVTTSTITFDTKGGSSVGNAVVESGKPFTAPATPPTKEGFTFDGWCKDTDCTMKWNFGTDTVTADTTLYAKWTANAATTFTVTFDTKGGRSVDKAVIESGKKVTEPTQPTKTGFTFDGWCKDADCATKWNFGTDTVTENTTLYAKWKVKDTGGGGSSGGDAGGGSSSDLYTLSFDTNGGMTVKSEQHKAGTAVTLNQTTLWENHRFVGWYADPELTQKITEIKMNSNKTVYAKWQSGKELLPTDTLDTVNHFAYVMGREDGFIHPEANITRAETAVIFFRLLRDDVRKENLTTTSAFTDVAQGAWCATEIATLTNMGILHGRTARVFDPNASITRAEFAAIASRFASEPYAGADLFSDISGYWAQKEINTAASYGWIQGGKDGTFRPKDDITRAETMVLVNRVLGRLPESKSDLQTDMITWPDNANAEGWFYLAVQEATNGHDYVRKTDGIHETWSKLLPPRDWAALER